MQMKCKCIGANLHRNYFQKHPFFRIVDISILNGWFYTALGALDYLFCKKTALCSSLVADPYCDHFHMLWQPSTSATQPQSDIVANMKLRQKMNV